MGTKRAQYWILPAFILLICAATPDKPAQSVSGRYIAADIDPQGNVYYIDSAYTIEKYVPGKGVVARQSLLRYGSGAILDVSNPVEPFVFYPVSGYLLVLDNQLNLQNETNLLEGENMAPAAFGRSNDGQIWIYDDNSHTLKKLNRQGEKLQESIWLEDASHEQGEGCNRIIDNGINIFLMTGGETLQVLDANLNRKYRGVRSRKTLVGLLDGAPLLGVDSIVCKEAWDPARAFMGLRPDTAVKLSQGEIPLAIKSGNTLFSSGQTLFLRTR
ncbi:MAG: hypothetical protein JNL57_01550 [Bacteroidetes bacterium]|nr:hypothetical protein [Bacteroidota bacterium]